MAFILSSSTTITGPFANNTISVAINALSNRETLFQLTDGTFNRKVIRHNISEVDRETGNYSLVNNPPYIGRIILWE